MALGMFSGRSAIALCPSPDRVNGDGSHEPLVSALWIVLARRSLVRPEWPVIGRGGLYLDGSLASWSDSSAPISRACCFVSTAMLIGCSWSSSCISDGISIVTSFGVFTAARRAFLDTKAGLVSETTASPCVFRLSS